MCAVVVAFSALTVSVSLFAVWTYCSSTARSMARLHCRHVITACRELWKVLFLVRSVTVLFVYEISREPLNGFVPNSQGRRIWSLVRMTLKVEVKGQGLEGHKRHFSALSTASGWFILVKHL